jgi:HK97 family phage portal protein
VSHHETPTLIVLLVGILRKALGLETLADEPPTGDYSANVTPPARSANGSVTVEKALSLPAAFRAVQIIAGMGSQLELFGIKAGQRLDPTPALLAQPDPWRPRSSFVERYLVNAATDGNNFLLKHRAGNGGPVVAVEALNPFAVKIRWENGVKFYDRYTAKGLKTYTDDEILHVWGLEVPGHDRGLGPIAACRYALAGHIDARDYAAGWFGGGSDVPSGVLSTDQPLDPATAKEYKRMWQNPQGFDEDGKPLPADLGPSVRIIGRGLSYAPIMLKPSEAQWLESQSFGVLDVARMFGVPADYLLASVEGNSLTYSNLEMVDAQFLRTTLFPVYLRKLEAALTELLPRGQEARFDVSELLRPDAKTRADIDSIYLGLNVYDANYVRTREGIAGPAPIPATAPTQEVPA